MQNTPFLRCKKLNFFPPFHLLTLFFHRHKYKELFNCENAPKGIILDAYKTRDAEVNNLFAIYVPFMRLFSLLDCISAFCSVQLLSSRR